MNEKSIPKQQIPVRILFVAVIVFAVLLAACDLPVMVTWAEPSDTAEPAYALIPAVTSTPFRPAVQAPAIATLTGTVTLTPEQTTAETGSVTPSETVTETPTLVFTDTQTATWAPGAGTATITRTWQTGSTATRTRTFTSTLVPATRTVTLTRTRTATQATATPSRTPTRSPTYNTTLVNPGGPVTADQLIAAVNQLRTGNGLPALRVNAILMQSAQWTAEYMAANHLLNHIGDVRGRIAALGYGSGAIVWATENWAMGYTTLSQIMVAWSDPAHMLPMTQSYYIDIGAGVATGPWGPYYIVHAAYTTGSTSTPAPATRTPTATATSTKTPSATLTIVPDTATPTPTVTVAVPTVCPASTDAGYEATLADLINQQRAAQGLPALTWSAALANAARGHSLDMACNGFFSHTGSDGSSPFDRILRAGYSYSYAGENLYAGSGGYNSPQAAVDAWMNSPGHRDNILGVNFTNIGIGYEFNPGSPYGGYYTAVFASP